MRELPELDESAFRDLITHLTSKRIAVNRYRGRVGEGRSQCFGMVRKRCQAPDLSRQSWMDARLHHLLMKFGSLYVPIPFTSIQINDSFLCASHKDKHNDGDSYIVGFGSYTGGELVLKNPTDTDYNIRHRPLLFNGAEIEHYTKQFTGRRFTLVYHTLIPPPKAPMTAKLTDYEACVVNGSWVIAWRKEGHPVQYLDRKNGLPHPMKGRNTKQKKAEAAQATNNALELIRQAAAEHQDTPL